MCSGRELVNTQTPSRGLHWGGESAFVTGPRVLLLQPLEEAMSELGRLPVRTDTLLVAFASKSRSPARLAGLGLSPADAEGKSTFHFSQIFHKLLGRGSSGVWKFVETEAAGLLENFWSLPTLKN